MMSPTISQHTDGSILVLGTGGAGRIPFVLAQMMGHYLLSPQADLEKIIAQPRIFATKDVFHYERPIDPAHWNEHPKSKIWGEGSLFFGGVNAIEYRNGHLRGAADPRRQGVVRVV